MGVLTAVDCHWSPIPEGHSLILSERMILPERITIAFTDPYSISSQSKSPLAVYMTLKLEMLDLFTRKYFLQLEKWSSFFLF